MAEPTLARPYGVIRVTESHRAGPLDTTWSFAGTCAQRSIETPAAHLHPDLASRRRRLTGRLLRPLQSGDHVDRYC